MKIRTMLAAIAVAGLLPLAAVAQDDIEGDEGDTSCAGLTTQADISDCVSARHAGSEEALTVAYQGAIAAQGANDEPLRVSQRAWIQRRDLDCETERAVFHGGSGEGTALGLCLVRWNEARWLGLLNLRDGQIGIPALDGYDAPEG